MQKFFPSLSCSSTTLMLWVGLWIGVACNFPLWMELGDLTDLDTWRGAFFLVAFIAIVTLLTTVSLLLLNYKRIRYVVIACFLLSAAFAAYFMYSYGIVTDSDMITNVLQTDVRETVDLLHWKMLIFVLFLAVVPWWVFKRITIIEVSFLQSLKRNVLWFIAYTLVGGSILLMVFQDFSSLMRNQTHVRFMINPLASFYSLVDVLLEPLNNRSPSIIVPIGQDAHLGEQYAQIKQKAPLLILVIGETARAANFGLNGYARQTTPQLQALSAGGEIVNFKNARSCGTSTAASVPCMFSHLSKKEFESRQNNYENLLDVLQRAGLAVLWVDNQSGCKGVCNRIIHSSTWQNLDYCSNKDCLDTIMLTQLDQFHGWLSTERRSKGTVIVLHQMGSHGPAYFKRSPKNLKQFQPECTSNDLRNCDRQQIINAYDNSILATDTFLTQTILWASGYQDYVLPAMMYVSDHGESLGENNLYLHGLPYAIAPDMQKHVPWLAWLSQPFAQHNQLGMKCVQSRQDEPISHDNYFHTVLGLMNIKTQLYQPQLDIFAPCRKASFVASTKQVQ